MPTAAEIITQLNALEGDEATVAVRLMQNDGGAVVKAARDKIAGGARKDGEKGGKEAARVLGEVRAALELADDADGEALVDAVKAAAAAKSSAPDLAAKEAEWKGKLAKKDEAITGLKGKLAARGRDDAVGKIVKLLTGDAAEVARLTGANPALKGLALGGVNPAYERVLRAEIGDRVQVDEDGNVTGVLKPGEATKYDADSTDHALALYAADHRKLVPAEFIRASGEGGGGVGGGSGGGGAVANTKQIEQAKRSTGAYAPL